MNKQRQRKLEARTRRQESLAKSGIANQEPKMYPGHRVSEEKLRKIYMKIGLQGVQDVRTEDVKEIKARNKRLNLLESSKLKKTAKVKEK